MTETVLWPDDVSVWRRIGRNFSISLVGSMASMIFGLGRTALLTKQLAIDDYGRVLIVLNFFGFLSMLLSIRVNDVLFYFFPQFKEAKDASALRDLVWLCLSITLIPGLIIGSGSFLASPWIAATVYKDPSLTSMFRIYSIAMFFLLLIRFYTPILQMNDRFRDIVLPQAIGGATSLAMLIFYFYVSDWYDLNIVIGSYLAGMIISTFPPFILAFSKIREILFIDSEKKLFSDLGNYRRQLVDTLFHSNLGGYLKLFFTPGDVFLLGVLSTPTQVARYGLIRQVTQPLLMLQDSVQNSVTPEVASLWAKRQLPRLYRVVQRYAIMAFLAGGILSIGAALFARPLIIIISNAEYLAALPIFYVMLLVLWLSAIFLIFYPVGLVMGKLKLFNFANLINLTILGVVLLTKRIDGLSLAYFQLLATLIRRVLTNIWIWIKLSALSGKEVPIIKEDA